MIRNQRMGWIGVDIGTHCVKLAQVEQQAGGIEVREAAIIQRLHAWEPTPPAPLSPRESVAELAAGKSLGNRFQGRLAACTVPISICDVRTMKLGEGRPEDLRRQAGRELGASAASGEQREFDYWPVSPGAWGSRPAQFDSNVISLAQNWAQRVADDHARAGLACRILDGLPTALARAVALVDKESRQATAALDWGWTDATFCSLHGGVPVYVRRLPHAGLGPVVAALRTQLTVSANEAMQLLTEHGLPPAAGPSTELQRVIGQVFADAASRFCAELDRTLDYLESHLPQWRPARIWLFGGGATIQHVEPWLTVRRSVPIVRWSMGSDCFESSEGGAMPVVLLGPAVALSALAWDAN